jgi:hypothetical protein
LGAYKRITVMIASRIWYLDNQGIHEGFRRRSSLHPIARVVVESGGIYSGLLIALLILYGQKSWFQYVVVDAVSNSHPTEHFLNLLTLGLPVVVPYCGFQSNTIPLNISDRLSNPGNRLFRHYSPYRSWSRH